MIERARFKDLKALIVGLAREGTALARFLASEGARVVVTDLKPAAELGESMARLSGLVVEYHLGQHPMDLLDRADVVFASPGVPLENALLVEARRRGISLHSETRLFTRLCPAPIVGITGSSGKSTTTALVGEILRANGQTTWVGGNIGQPLIGHLDAMGTADAVVMELSSFQLELMKDQPRSPAAAVAANPFLSHKGWSPHVAAVLNVTPNHLDRHASMADYVAAKKQILAGQGPGDAAVLGLDNALTRRMGEASGHRQRILWFSQEAEVEQGTFLNGEDLVLRFAGREEKVCRASELRLPGRHNVANTLAACAVAAAAGAGVEAMHRAVTAFTGVPHRLELVRERDGVRWYNDSIATTPERTMAALEAFSARIVLLAGGRDKHLPWESMAELTWRKVQHLILFGEAEGLIAAAMAAAAPRAGCPCHIHRAGTLEKAVELAGQVAPRGGIVLLSPGGTSFDRYRDYEARGEHFRHLVEALE